MKFLDLFAGIGGFRLGMEEAGHECVGYVEWDKYARKSYEAIHDTEGEWTWHDVSTIDYRELPRADIWTFGFPCQDISIGGRQEGFRGNRSSLFFAVTKRLRQIKEWDSERMPTFLLIENVKNFLSVNNGWDFLAAQIELDEIGYNMEWQVLNSKEFGVAQNRERVFIVGHLRGRSTRQVFPVGGTYETPGIDVIGTTKNPEAKGTNSRHWVHDPNGIVGAISATDYKQPKQIKFRDNNSKGYTEAVAGDGIRLAHPYSKTARGRVQKQVSPTLTTNADNGVLLKNYRIRKLTPREYWRLQSFPDWAFDKAAAVNTDVQLYKQAGNSVTVNVIYEIAKRLGVDE
jgi:DNA (cytosine-5)-methyltransferase 1